MACALTQGYTLDCRDNVGGIKAIYVTELENQKTLTAASGVITAFALNTGKQFWAYVLEKEKTSLTENIMTSDQNGTVYYEQDLDFTIRKLTPSWRSEIINLAKNRLMVIILDRNGVYWLCGQNNGMEMQASKGQTGKMMGDFNGYEIKFKGKEEIPMQQVTGSLLTTLIVPGT